MRAHLWITVVVACAAEPSAVDAPEVGPPPPCGGFDWPVGAPDGMGYYDAQPFGRNAHLGEDWNGNGGGDTDRGDPVFVIADGVVAVATHEGEGWGNVVRVVHACGDGQAADIESLYAHLGVIDVAVGDVVRRGERLGTIGDADGAYVPHLHLELRANVGAPLGGGYGEPNGHVAPSEFIARHRPR